MRFSIIIPVYNVEKYIRKCMDTIMNQTFRDYEVIVVDDESPDNSMRIVEEFAASFPGMIKMIHQKNTRQGGARNRGVREARGEYLLFVDSDDYVDLKMLEVVDARLRENPCDILVFRNVTVSESGKRITESGFNGLKPGVYEPKRDQEILLLPIGPVNKAYRRAFYLDSGVQFPEKLLYEDAAVRLLYAKASRVVLCEECLYYYVQSGNSTMRRRVSEKMLDILTVTDLVYEAFCTEKLYDSFRDTLEFSFLLGILHILDTVMAEKITHPLLIPLTDYMAERFPNYKKNPYLSKAMKESISCLISHHFHRYYFRFYLIMRAKEWLIQWPVIAKLNNMRKGL